MRALKTTAKLFLTCPLCSRRKMRKSITSFLLHPHTIPEVRLLAVSGSTLTPLTFKGTPASQIPAINLFLGQRSVSWTRIFAKIRNPDGLWTFWGPKTVGAYLEVQDLWEMWTEGEISVDAQGLRWKKPPVRDVQAAFRDEWHTPVNGVRHCILFPWRHADGRAG